MILAGILIHPHSVVAQHIVPMATCPPEGCDYSVRVSPDAGVQEHPENSGPWTAAFEIEHIGNTGGSYSLTCITTGGVTCLPLSPTTISLTPGQAKTVNVQYTLGASGGTLRLSAVRGKTGDGGLYTVNAVAVGPPIVALRNHNRDNVDRSLCLTAGAGEAAAWSCGDLVITHSMPGYATMGRQRALTLIHNSATAYPRPPIAASITIPSTIAKPDSVFVQLIVGGMARDSADYGGWSSGSLGTRQVVLDFSGTLYATGAYPLQLRVQNRYGSALYETLVQDTLLIVNRSSSEYGAGFSLAGLEQLYVDQPVGTGMHHILWVGGDGSAKLYRQIDSTTWTGAAGAFRETISLSLSDSVYTRSLRHGIRVRFDRRGRHIATINRAGQQTAFTWDSLRNRLVGITVPPGVAGTTYTLAWDTNGNLDYLEDPAGRKLDATFNFNDGRLNKLTDPDGNSVVFGWDGDRRIISRRSRRGFTTTFEYSLGRAVGSRVTRVTAPVGRTVGDTATAVTMFDSWNDRGLATGISGQSAAALAQAYTKIYGPRWPGVADTAAFIVDRWGAPTRTVNAIGAVTLISRGDTGRPALVTKVTSPDGRVDSMAYDTRGNLLELRTITSGVSGSIPLATAVARWTYHAATAPDSPDSIIDPEGVVTRFAYDSLGLTSQMTAANGHITQFVTIADDSLKGLVMAVNELAVPSWDDSLRQEVPRTLRTAFAYDAFGNVVADTSPMGRVRRFTRDTRRRVNNFYDAAGHRTEYDYDELNRTLHVAQHVEQDGAPGYPRDPGFSSPLTSAWSYSTDVLSMVVDPRGVVRYYEYDKAGRAVREQDDYVHADNRWYNRAGLVDSVLSRIGSKVRHSYDAAGRLTKTAWPAGTGASADSVIYSYDIMDRLTQAATSAATVTRTYYGNGALRSEVLNSTTPSLAVTQVYYYDRAGRRAAYRTGTANDRAHSDSVSYFYDAAGDLAKILVKWRTIGSTVADDYVRFRWDALGRRDTLAYSNGMSFAFGYDRDGTQRFICTTARVANPGTNDISRFRVVHDTVDLDGLIRKTNAARPAPANCEVTNSLAGYAPANTYDNRHQLTSQADGAHNAAYDYDGSGNMIWSLVDGYVAIDSMAPNHNRLIKRAETGGLYHFYDYTDDGSRFSENPCPTTFTCQPKPGYRRYLYDGLGRMVGTSGYDCPGGVCQIIPVVGCRYDPLNRLILPCENMAPRLAYDGPNVVRTGPDTSGGGDWTFIHGPAVDDPVLGHFSGSTMVAYFVTDGQGRQLRVLARDGTDFSGLLAYTQQGGKYAGGTANGSSFGAERHASSDVPKVSFFRNRAYDQQTGRWTQEDPVGVAGGLNLYQFNANNPATFTDPFGLYIRYEGTDEEKDYLWRAMQDVKSRLGRQAKKNRGAREMLAAIKEMETDPNYTVVISAGNAKYGEFGETSNNGLRITIDYAAGAKSPGRFYPPATLAHELGHSYAKVGADIFSRFKSMANGVVWGNIYRAMIGACQQDLNHAPVALFPDASGRCEP
jgi:RHS repeat-associated protein